MRWPLLSRYSSQTKKSIKVLALNNLEQLLLEYPDLRVYLAKEHSEAIKMWNGQLFCDSELRIENISRALLSPPIILFPET